MTPPSCVRPLVAPRAAAFSGACCTSPRRTRQIRGRSSSHTSSRAPYRSSSAVSTPRGVRRTSASPRSGSLSTRWTTPATPRSARGLRPTSCWTPRAPCSTSASRKRANTGTTCASSSRLCGGGVSLQSPTRRRSAVGDPDQDDGAGHRCRSVTSPCPHHTGGRKGLHRGYMRKTTEVKREGGG